MSTVAFIDSIATDRYLQQEDSKDESLAHTIELDDDLSLEDDAQSIAELQARRTSIAEQAKKVIRGVSVGAEEQRDPSYHQDAKAQYYLPNDLPEHVRLEKQAAHLSKVMDDQILHAPVGDASRILDIGCGTGIVTDLMSEAYPEADCIGLDLSTVPHIRPHRSNVRFFQGNVSSQDPTEWTAAAGSALPHDTNLFDYIFSRLLILGISDWPSFIVKELSLLKPGGWAEIQDLAWDYFDQSGAIISSSWQWLEVMNSHLQAKGMDPHCGAKAARWMEEAGFEEVRTFRYVMPFCGESEATMEMREYGKFNCVSVPMMLHHAIPRASGQAEGERVEAMRREMRECLRGGRGTCQAFYVTIGRKPVV
ncbi:hypothetical protein DOTSEDRAFT_67413 [Dothistroma septosporum NZE10]|uniref:Methyltransferase domain-containing protein n=1 Tax=Dothistroma septosporum (strain NZE10 / CBS 128990) TaxID=675120 RepID=N1PZ89_DOTSN|nr:hypothetical protein DOTSEDRAFT_67413 [Dothistroma septosporum NZE10]